MSSSPLLGLFRRRTTPRPNWSERQWHDVVVGSSGPEVVPWSQPLPDREVRQGVSYLSPSGWSVVLPLVAADDEPNRWRRDLVLLDRSTRAYVDLGLRTAPGEHGSVADLAVAPDDRRIAVVRRSVGTGSTLSVVDTTTSCVEETIDLSGYWLHRHNDVNLQWCPDGGLLAATVVTSSGHRRGVRVLDAATLETVSTFDRCSLLGSLSWSSEGDRIAVRHGDRAHVLDVATGRLHPLSWLPDEIRDPPAAPAVLGLLSRGRALVLRQTSRRARLFVVDVDTGRSVELASLRITERDWPVQLQCARGWDALAADRDDEGERVVLDQEHREDDAVG